MADLTNDELELLKNPPNALEWWDAKGSVAKLLAAGLLTYKPRGRVIPSYVQSWAEFERTEDGDKAIATEPR